MKRLLAVTPFEAWLGNVVCLRVDHDAGRALLRVAVGPGYLDQWVFMPLFVRMWLRAQAVRAGGPLGSSAAAVPLTLVSTKKNPLQSHSSHGVTVAGCSGAPGSLSNATRKPYALKY